jgi:hypothetical protein
MEEINYKTLEKLIQELEKGVSKVKEGSMSSLELNSLLIASRSLHERIAILQYLKEKETSEEEIETDEVVEKNQINLLDAIVEVEEDVTENMEEKTDIRTINEIHATSPQTSLAEQFGKQPILDLTKEIGINERFLLTENLFNGDAKTYNEAINKLNCFSELDEAITYFKHDLAKEFNWNLKSNQVKRFIKLIERRYQN